MAKLTALISQESKSVPVKSIPLDVEDFQCNQALCQGFCRFPHCNSLEDSSSATCIRSPPSPGMC